MKGKAAAVTLALALGLLLFALIMSLTMKDGALDAVAEELNALGYGLTGDDLLVLGGAEGTSIAALLGDGADMASLIEASRAAGFSSDTNKVGEVTVLLTNVDSGVLTVYLVDGEIELCFIEGADGEILAAK